MPKRKIIDELQEEIKEEVEIKIGDFIPEPPKKQEGKKKAYIVVLVNPSIVVYKTSSTTNSHTQNIWGDKLVPGDTIYLGE